MTDRLAETRAQLADLVAFPSLTFAPNLDIAGHVADRLARSGARVELVHSDDGTRANVFATLGPEGDGGIVLSGHLDVVPVEDQDWTSDPFTLREDAGRLYGRGTCDMKGFVAAALALAPAFAAADLKRPLHFAFTYDEEIGCLGAQGLVKHLQARGLRPSLAIVGEPTGMKIVEGHKGCFEYTTRFRGLEGHGSDPDRGVNAVEYAVRYAARLLEMRDELVRRAPAASRFEPPWTTLSLGRMSGGVARNVIAGSAEIEWELRPVNAADADYVRTEMARTVREALLPAMRRVWPEAEIDTEVIAEIQGLDPMPGNEAAALVTELTGANATGLVPFGTEAGLFQSMGMSVVVCGPGHIAQAHKADEYVSLDQLGACLAMLEGLKNRLAR